MSSFDLRYLTYCALSRSSSAHDCNSFARRELEIDILEDFWSIQIILDCHISKLDLASCWPILGDGGFGVIRVLSDFLDLFRLLFWLNGGIFSDSMELLRY